MLNAEIKFDHLNSHKEWFRYIHNTEWNSDGNYCYRNTDLPSPSDPLKEYSLTRPSRKQLHTDIKRQLFTTEGRVQSRTVQPYRIENVKKIA